MAKDFLQKIAERLVNDSQMELKNFIVVLPNKRASLFLKKYLSELINKPTWIPEIISTEELVERFSNVQLIDNTTQLFELYACYKNQEKEPDNFDEFVQWGQVLLHDFNEIDRYLIDSSQLFKHVNEARAIEVWNVNGEELTELQIKYLKFWESLGGLYERFSNHLATRKMAYQGLAYRKVAEEIAKNPEEFGSRFLPNNTVLFAGFNALNKAEELIISSLKKVNKCEVIFDADDFYMSNELHEAGLFLRKFRNNTTYDPFEYVGQQFKEEAKEINILGIPQNVGQAKYLTQLLSDTKQEQLTDTAVVLADEQLLVPVLQSIPDTIEHINVTMGYPIRNTTTSNFFDAFLTLMVNAERFGKTSDLTFHYKDILKWIQLPLSQLIVGKSVCEEIRSHIVKHNWVFIRKDKLQWINERMASQLPTSFHVNDMLDQCLGFIENGKAHFVKEKEEGRKRDLELEYLFHFAKLFNQLKTLITEYPFLDTAKGTYSLYRQLLGNYSIDLYGEPLRGLQVLGMLETRNIDFKRVILLSANEGVLPAGKTFNSFIPYDIKNAFHLPTHVEKDAIYSYHFYRLLQYAQRVDILYNTETNEFGSGEQSRFLTQIENELEKYNKQITISKDIITYPTLTPEQNLTSIAKTPAMLEKLKDRFNKGISPSAILSYLNCPADFYFNYVLGVGDEDKVEETIQMNTFGDYVHESLELLYKPLLNQTLTAEVLKKLISKSDSVVEGVFRQNYTERDLNAGKNLISLKVAQNYVKNYLKQEKDQIKQGAQIEVLSLEEELRGSILVDGVQIALKGKADRVQRTNGVLQIIDFKTGKVEKKDLNMSAMNQVVKRDKSLQVLMYAYLYNQQHNTPTLNTGVFSFRLLKEGYLPLNIKKNTTIDSSVLNDFEQELAAVIREILDVNIPFVHEEESLYCEFCG